MSVMGVISCIYLSDRWLFSGYLVYILTALLEYPRHHLDYQLCERNNISIYNPNAKQGAQDKNLPQP